MSADMMIICKEDDSGFEGQNTDAAFFVDETSMGEPWSKFGVWFCRRFCKAPNILEQLAGQREHHFAEFTEADFVGVKKALEKMETHQDLNKEKLIEFLQNHIGKHLSTENW